MCDYIDIFPWMLSLLYIYSVREQQIITVNILKLRLMGHFLTIIFGFSDLKLENRKTPNNSACIALWRAYSYIQKDKEQFEHFTQVGNIF